MPRDRNGLEMTVGVDTGGTFTDVVIRIAGVIATFKVLSTPRDPAAAVVEALEEAAESLGVRRVRALTYGTTVATNAMLERRGARTALVTTAGFEDVLELGRQARPQLYELEPVKVEPLVAPRFRIGVRERTLFDGSVLVPLSGGEVARIVAKLRRLRVESIAVCLLHAPASSRHERRLAHALERLKVPVSSSAALAPRPGEYERSSTTVANAYVRPFVEKHLRTLARRTRARALRVMQSNGGAIGAATAAREPIRTMLSGPAGGVAAATTVAALAGVKSVITLDMGGTSTDVALVDGRPERRATTEIGGIAIRTPCLDIHTVGAGGGSIAAIDEGGALRVGPESAGAEPGPACYGRGTLPTVTDANLVLGRLRSEAFLGGRMALDSARAERVLKELGHRMGGRSASAAAEGVIRVVENTMERAIRMITVERGRDPRSSVLVPFGGAAGLHACALAETLGIGEILVPTHPGLLSAIGMLDAELVRDAYRPLQATAPTYESLTRVAQPLEKQVAREIALGSSSRVRVETYAELRYAGEGSTIDVRLTRDFMSSFHREHLAAFHSSDTSRTVECCGIRVTAISEPPREGRRRHEPRSQGTSTRSRTRARITLDGKLASVPLLDRATLRPRDRLDGPVLITEFSSTLLLLAGWSLRLDGHRNLRVARRRA